MSRAPYFVLLAAFVIGACGGGAPAPDGDTFTSWARYEGEPGATSFSALDQVNRSNVDQLEIVWEYASPGVEDMNPIIVDSLMYVIDGGDAVVALHAGTGETVWTHTNSTPGSYGGHGLTYWESEDRSDRRIYLARGAFHLIAIDALTGGLVQEFGDDGRLDLRPGLGREPERITRATPWSPPVVFEDLIITGSATGEGYVATPGHIRAFDARTGEQEWIFHTLPKPGEFGYDTWPEGRSDDASGANAWGGMSLDIERGIVYAPLGSANYDFFGADRHGENLFANSLVALDARTGERVWHFQTVHHDLWDYDLTATPVLLTVNQEGEERDIVVLATKMGLVFVFDRVTGEPLWPIEEQPVPASDIPGEQAWPTQPIPTRPEPFVPTTMDVEADINPYLVESDRDSLVSLVRSMRYEGMYTPPSTEPTLQVPGNRGGANWGSTAGDPRDGTFIVLSYNMPSILHLVPIVASNRTGTGSSPIDDGQVLFQERCAVCHGVDRQGQPSAGIASLDGVLGRLDEVEFANVIQNGRNSMPGFPDLDAGDISDLQMYLANPDLALVEDDASLDEGETPGPADIRYQSAWRHVLDSQGVPVIQPPWFRLTAYDMNDGTIKWQVPTGDVAHLAEQGIEGTGSAVFLRGGPTVTAGGLVFLSTEQKLRAYDLDTGEELWAGDLPGAGEAMPAVYEVNGRQFIVVAATEGNRWGQQPDVEVPRRPSYVAFALPE